MDEAQSLRALLGEIAAEFEVAMGRPEQVRAGCASLREQLSLPPSDPERAVLRELAALLQKRMGPIAVPLFEMLEDLASRSEEPWALLEGLLLSRDAALARRALVLTETLCTAGALALGTDALRFLAAQAEQAGSPLAQPEALATIARILRRSEPESRDPVTGLYLESLEGDVRRLAARLLDLEGQPAPPETAERVLGAEAHAFLGPYLRYTRASHLDLLHLVAEPGTAPPALASLRRAEALCGEAPLRKAIAELGWSRVNLGVEVRACTGVRFGSALPLMVSPAEASLLESCGHARRTAEPWLIVAHGGSPAAREVRGSDKVSRFRAYNLAHAAALADILDVAPLTREKAQRILERMDRIVEDFIAIFAAHAEECAVLPGLYHELRARVVHELEKEGSPVQLSAELTRLVQAFEDPRSVGEVRTLHGLKRYLHQRGLRLGFRLVEAGGGTNRTVDLVLASRTRAQRSLKKIAYVDFEPETAMAIPYAVVLLVEGFARQLLHGQESFPSAQIFCYGNEVHYYLAFKNHPAFLRIDYSPPLAGGMIDLEYYGVSVYELSAHPSPSLEALRLFFRALEFHIQIDGTHVHARYDKERALDLGDVCDKAETLCCLVPYLMDLDWVIGSLRLDAEARRRVSEAWAESFAEWGVLPLRGLLSRDRQSVLVDVETGAAGDREIAWSGELPYRDRFRVPAPGELWPRLRTWLGTLGLGTAPLGGQETDRLIGQLQLERQVLRPLREALARGALLDTAVGLRAPPPDLFDRRHEAGVFAEMIASGEVGGAVRLARLVAPLERTLRFRGTGRVNGHELQRARLALRGERVGLYVLRDPGGIIRLAVFSRGEILGRRRDDTAGPWRALWSADPAELAALLRRNGYLAPGAEPGEVPGEEVAEVLTLFRGSCPAHGPRPLPGERVLQGFRASPGRAVGRALFGTAGRRPEDLDGAVLVAPSVSPEDNTFLYHARGIVSTGGGILSHAGLIATQFAKPALIVSGQWLQEKDGSVALLYRSPEYREESRQTDGVPLTLFRDWHEREHRLSEGDLVVLDATAGTLKVLGQDRDALALHEELWRFGEAGRRLARSEDVQELLALRGRRVRAAHQLRKLLDRLADPLLARHAAHELLAGEALAGEAASPENRAELLDALLRNPSAGEAAVEYLQELTAELHERCTDLFHRARRRIPAAATVHEVLALRLEMIGLVRALAEALSSLRASGVALPRPAESARPDVDALTLVRLQELRGARLEELAAAAEPDPRLRHLLRQLERLDRLLGAPEVPGVGHARERLACRDESLRRTFRERAVVSGLEAGFELHPLIGWKAANLGEVTRLGGAGLVPPFFVVTDHAFAQVFEEPLARLAPAVEDLPPGAGNLREAVAALLARGDLDNARKSARIRALWDAIRLPDELAREVVAAYRGLADPAPAASEDREGPFVAIRSSAREEDAELAARAGEFETFLFVRGEERVLEHLKRAWSGLWTERAIHNRALLGTGDERTGGGVVFQRIVWSRVSGVLQTVNVAESEPREMVINVGLGLGEGIVSGSVAADHVVVAKEGDLARGPLRFRYVTADKREQVGFDRRAGFGTSRLECLYHQRLRPALEYVELCELVGIAARLEAAYGYPLDIEFGIEGSRLFILQARPVATFLSLLRETVERHPLRSAAEADAVTAGEGVRS